MQTHIRGYCDRAAAAQLDKSDAGTPIRFVATTDAIARDGLVIDANAWQLDNYRNNPVFLWAHDYTGQRPPIGRADNVHVDVALGRLLCDVVFDQGDEFAREIERKYRSGFLNTVSVGWDTQEMQSVDNPNVSGRVTKAELLDISGVPVPGDPHALMERQKRAYRDMGRELLHLAEDEIEPETRGALPFVATDKAPVDASWDAGAEVKAADSKDQLRRMFAWVDSNGDPEAKGSYKLPHHTAEGDVVWRGVAAAMARLPQSDIPDADQGAVFNHLAKHYAQFDKEPPKRGVVDAEGRVPALDELRRRVTQATEAEPPTPLVPRPTWTETSAEMAALFRPFAQRPDEERKADHQRLARDYARHKKTPPEFLPRDTLDALSADEVRALFLEGEPELHADIFAAMAIRAGAVLSQRNLDDVKQIQALAAGILERASKDSQKADDSHAAPDPTDNDEISRYLLDLQQQLGA